MCFEFEALYWAKLAEEEERKRLAQRKQPTENAPEHQPAEIEEHVAPA